MKIFRYEDLSNDLQEIIDQFYSTPKVTEKYSIDSKGNRKLLVNDGTDHSREVFYEYYNTSITPDILLESLLERGSSYLSYYGDEKMGMLIKSLEKLVKKGILEKKTYYKLREDVEVLEEQ
jgi:hypothetical protein